MGKFISFIPTPYEEVKDFFELAPVSGADVVYRFECGALCSGNSVHHRAATVSVRQNGGTNSPVYTLN